MKIFTSYFAGYAKLSEGLDLLSVSIARSSPTWYKGIVFPLLAPSWALLGMYKRGQVNAKEYTVLFTEEILQTFYFRSTDQLRQHLNIVFEGKDIVLLCWEAPGQFCHRRIVAEWLGPDVVELS